MGDSVHRHVRTIYELAGHDPAVPRGARALERALLGSRSSLGTIDSARKVAQWYVRRFDVQDVGVDELAEAIAVPASALVIMRRLLFLSIDAIAFVLDVPADLVRWRLRDVLFGEVTDVKPPRGRVSMRSRQ